MSKQPKSHLKRLATFDYINSAVLLLIAVCCVYPFLYVFFAQGAKVQIESCGPELTIEWSCSGHVARLQANLQKLTYRVEIE